MSLTLKRQRPIPAWEQIYSPSWCRIGLSRRFYATGVGKAHRASQAGEGLGAGEHWTDSGLVFTTEFGRPVEPRNILRTAELAAKKAGVEGVGVHTLRHSAATAWLDAGVHINAVADLLGHSSIAITGDVYGHTTHDVARAAIDGRAGRLRL